jgi:hypothetical protein
LQCITRINNNEKQDERARDINKEWSETQELASLPAKMESHVVLCIRRGILTYYIFNCAVTFEWLCFYFKKDDIHKINFSLLYKIIIALSS